MARPLKHGVDYFPWDVDSLRDMKVRKILRANGASSIAVLICLLGNIYGDEGYYMLWDEDARFLIADDVGVKESYVQAVVEKATQVGFFDSEIFSGLKILTSRGIQKRYQNITGKRKENELRKDIDLINGVSGVNNPVMDADNYTSTGISGVDNPQSKVKESKVNKNKTDSQAGVRVHENARLLWQNVWGFPNAIATQDLEEWIGNFGDDLVCWVIKYAARKDVKAKGADRYLAKVFDGYTERKIKTVDQAEAESRKHEETARANYTGPQRYGKPERVDKEPDWLKPGYQEPKHEVTPEQRAKLAEQLEQLNKLGDKN